MAKHLCSSNLDEPPLFPAVIPVSDRKMQEKEKKRTQQQDIIHPSGLPGLFNACCDRPYILYPRKSHSSTTPTAAPDGAVCGSDEIDSSHCTPQMIPGNDEDVGIGTREGEVVHSQWIALGTSYTENSGDEAIVDGESGASYLHQNEHRRSPVPGEPARTIRPREKNRVFDSGSRLANDGTTTCYALAIIQITVGVTALQTPRVLDALRIKAGAMGVVPIMHINHGGTLRGKASLQLRRNCPVPILDAIPIPDQTKATFLHQALARPVFVHLLPVYTNRSKSEAIGKPKEENKLGTNVSLPDSSRSRR
ncbi:hypothetical protein IW261DRAFT_1594387 [Armillaria novae-zelandiae]|uniref:Uncharacterized protein n=1 Tax=Armillaria novae-zelandiae TaxID=153914 RepID=A0AA39U9C8_9AGAR|nr:hypothetical protein IW261DRAFT_1594387 [Armillaria novae-zelandiae]